MAVSDATQKIGQYGRDFAPLTFAAGFVYGATNDISYSGGTGVGTALARTQDTIARVTGVQLDLQSGYGKTTQQRSFNPGNILNYGTYGAIGLEIAYEATHNRWVKLAKDVLQPPLAGYGAGKVFDAPYMPNIPGSQPNLPTTASWQTA